MTCAIYCRLSKEDEGKASESESIQNQKSMLMDYATRQGWVVYRIYCDEDYSGVDRERPDWNAMLEAARSRRFQVILCKTQSRFTRDMELVERYIHGLFPLWGIRFVAVVDNIDTELKGNKKARQINGLINEWYLEDLSENIRAVFAQKRSAGQYIGSFPVYGYQKAPGDHNRLIVDPPAAEVVRTIFHLCLQGLGKQRIAERLNEWGLPNPTAYKREKGWNYHNGGTGNGEGLWSRTTVGRILRNEMYTGTMVQGVKRRVSYKAKACVSLPQDQWSRVAGTHEAIVERETFDTVQRLLAQRTRSGAAGKPHLLAGKVRCADCGSGMVKVSHRYKGTQHSYLQCRLYAASRRAPQCARHSVRLDDLTAAVEERVRFYVDAWYDAERGGLRQELLSRRPGLQKERLALQSQIARREDALRSLYLDRVDGLIGREQFAEMNRRFLEEKERLETRLNRLQWADREAGSPASDGGEEIQALLRLDPMPQRLVDLLIDFVEIGEWQPDGTQNIRIYWRI
ncbi:recombinase family protein [Ligaoa zhengdingensis]|uniref:recombinase family protein n=1 Tax=Ligaoa zhengdingensis TaxID=2763658 RepID=UPI0031BAF76D